MKTSAKIAIILLVAVAAATAIVLKGNQSRDAANSTTPVSTSVAGSSEATAKLPKLLELGVDL